MKWHSNFRKTSQSRKSQNKTKMKPKRLLKSAKIAGKEVERVEKRMIIAAKQAKPELAKYQSELVLPDIQKVDPKAQAATQKELDDAEADKAQYLAKLGSEFKNFNGYNATFKDTEVEMAIGYNVGEDEKTALKTQLESFAQTGYSGFFGELWFDKDGVPDIKRIVED